MFLKLWGLIKQGWKCKDCGINAHRGCKDRIVIECRSKRTFNLPRQTSSSVSETMRKRSTSTRSSTREHPKVKQKATQTKNYDDLFMSDDSMSSNEDNYHRSSNNTLFSSDTLIDNNDWNFDEMSKSTRSSTLTNRNDSSPSVSQSQRANRHRPYKKPPKRRKSLPSQCSATEEPHPSVTLIPRGPLICSNSENLESWLPERLFLNQTTITSPILVNTNSNANLIVNNNNAANLSSSSYISKSVDESASNSVNTNDSSTNSIDSTTNLIESKYQNLEPSATPVVAKSAQTTICDSNTQTINKFPKLTNNTTVLNKTSYLSNKYNSIFTKENPDTRSTSPASQLIKIPAQNTDSTKKLEKKNSESFLLARSNNQSLASPNPSSFSRPSTRLIPRPIETIAFKPSKLELISIKPLVNSNSPSRLRIESECDLNDLIERYNSDNLNESVYSSNEEDNDVFIKLKEAQKV